MTDTHCADHAAQGALGASGVNGVGEPVVIPLGALIDAAFEAEAWALDARLTRVELAGRAPAWSPEPRDCADDRRGADPLQPPPGEPR